MHYTGAGCNLAEKDKREVCWPLQQRYSVLCHGSECPTFYQIVLSHLALIVAFELPAVGFEVPLDQIHELTDTISSAGTDDHTTFAVLQGLTRP